MVGYHGVYWEYFRLVDSVERLDVHSFNPRRDGWDLGFLKRLLRVHGVRQPAGTARLECEKRFLLGCGEVSDTSDLVADDGGSFGYLATGPGKETSQARLVLRGPEQEVVLDPGPLPETTVPRGAAHWLGSAGWSTVETFQTAPAGSSLTFCNGERYTERELPEAASSPEEFLL